MSPRSSMLALITVCAVGNACRDQAPGAVCTDELRVHFSPADTTILASQSFRASVQLATCGGKILLSDVFAWQTDNSSVATVDPRTGEVIGRQAGQASITATGERYGAIGGIRVSVIVTGS